MPKTTPPVQTPGENQPPANEPEQQAAALAAAPTQAPALVHGARTHDEICATMKHGDPAERAIDGRWVVPPEYGTFTRPNGVRVTRLADGKIVEG